MRKPFAVLLLLTIIFSGIYFYTLVGVACDIPISYRIGHLDNRFDITHDEARAAVYEAEKVWEETTGVNLFDYDNKADFAINFVFDDRQEFANAEINFRRHLDQTENANSEISETYAELVGRYNKLELEYKNRVESYQRRLSSYNSKVIEFNEQGGAPKDVFEELQIEKSILDSEVKTINSLGSELNELVRQINDLSEEGNKLIEDYNQNVDIYNDTFGDTREFTQGDYQGDKINIYKFVDQAELKLVLLHELGHALSLDHVEGENSIMYHHLGKQDESLSLTNEDLEEFDTTCGEKAPGAFARLIELFWKNSQ